MKIFVNLKRASIYVLLFFLIFSLFSVNRANKKSCATRGGRVAVKNTLAYTRQLFNLAKKKKLVDTNPVVEIESLGASGARDRVLSLIRTLVVLEPD